MSICVCEHFFGMDQFSQIFKESTLSGPCVMLTGKCFVIPYIPYDDTTWQTSDDDPPLDYTVEPAL